MESSFARLRGQLEALSEESRVLFATACAVEALPLARLGSKESAQLAKELGEVLWTLAVSEAIEDQKKAAYSERVRKLVLMATEDADRPEYYAMLGMSVVLVAFGSSANLKSAEQAAGTMLDIIASLEALAEDGPEATFRVDPRDEQKDSPGEAAQFEFTQSILEMLTSTQGSGRWSLVRERSEKEADRLRAYLQEVSNSLDWKLQDD